MEERTTTWRRELAEEREIHRDTSPVVAVAGEKGALDVEFCPDSFGVINGPPVTVWSEERVYFVLINTRGEWMGSVPRNPQPTPEDHK